MADLIMDEAGNPTRGSETLEANSNVDNAEGIDTVANGSAEGASIPDTADDKEQNKSSVVYRVECRDRHDILIRNFESDKPFDLEVSQDPIQEQSETVTDVTEDDAPILEIVTRVKGSTFYRPNDPDINMDYPASLADFAISSKGPAVMIIKSQLLLKMLRDVVLYYPPQELTGDTVSITEPYPVLIHHMDAFTELVSKLKAEADQKPSEQGNVVCEKIRHLQVLLDFLQPVMKKIVRPAIEKLKRPIPVVTFDLLWYLFRPGADLYIKSVATIGERTTTGVMMYTALERSEDRYSRDKESGIYINYFKLQANGVMMGRGRLSRLIEYFEGEREVTSLTVYPASFWDDQDSGERRRCFEEQGERMYQIFRDGHRQMKFTGYTNSERKVYVRGH